MSEYSRFKILVLGARERHALTIVRSLGKAGAQVYTADSFHFATAALSVYSKGFFLYADPENQAQRFLVDLELILRENKFDFVFVVSDLLPILISKNMSRFEGLSRIAITPLEIFEKANNKELTFEIAQKNQVPAPKTRAFEKMTELESFVADFQFPVVLKPVSKTLVKDAQKSTSMKVHYAQSKPELLELFVDLEEEGRRFLLQEYIPGNGGEGVGALFKKGKALATFSYKRLHEYPLTGGASTLRVSTQDELLKSQAVKLLEALNWEGVAMVEFKRDIRSGEAKLVEVNGRYWGSLALAVGSGVDFPLLHLKSLLEEASLPALSYKVGHKQRWLIPGDLMYVFQKIRLEGFKALKDFLSDLWVQDDVWSWKDPLPIVGEIRSSLFYLIQVLQGKRSMSGEYLGEKSPSLKP